MNPQFFERSSEYVIPDVSSLHKSVIESDLDKKKTTNEKVMKSDTFTDLTLKRKEAVKDFVNSELDFHIVSSETESELNKDFWIPVRELFEQVNIWGFKRFGETVFPLEFLLFWESLTEIPTTDIEEDKMYGVSYKNLELQKQTTMMTSSIPDVVKSLSELMDKNIVIPKDYKVLTENYKGLTEEYTDSISTAYDLMKPALDLYYESISQKKTELENKFKDLQKQWARFVIEIPDVDKYDVTELTNLYNEVVSTIMNHQSQMVEKLSKEVEWLSNGQIIEEIKMLSEDAFLPVRSSNFAACKDLKSPIDCIVPAGKNLLIKTNVAIAWDNTDYYMQLLSRSGLAYKSNIVVQAGVIDVDYRQNIGVLLQNNSNVDFEVKRGDRIAQYTYIKIIKDKSTVVSEFTIPLESNRVGGFGSTGK